MNSGGGLCRSGKKWTSVGHVRDLVADVGSYKAGDVQATPGPRNSCHRKHKTGFLTLHSQLAHSGTLMLRDFHLSLFALYSS